MQVNLFNLVRNTMNLLICMRLLFVDTVNLLQFLFLLFFHCQIKWICLIAAEWGLWNNSWVKNLPVRPLAPRRKTPGQLYPAFKWPPGLGQKYSKTKYLQLLPVPCLNTSNKPYDYINSKLSINNELTSMIPSPSATSLFTVGFWTPVLSYWWIVANQFAKSAVLFSLRINWEYSF